MRELKRVSKTFFGYLKRPDLYPELGRKIYKNIFQRRSAFRGREKTEIWAKSLAITQQEAVKNLFGLDYNSLSVLFPEDISTAHRTEKACPVKMGGAGALELIYYACEFTQAKAVLETGVAYGWSSLAALFSLQKRDGVLYSSDMPYLGQNGAAHVGCVVPEKLKKNWWLFRHADRESLPKIFAGQELFDVVHYDSDKSYEGRTWAYETLYAHLRPGGIFISDDIADNSAYEDFCEKNSVVSTVVSFDGKYVGIFVKEDR